MAADVGGVLVPRLTSDAAVTALVDDRITPGLPTGEPGDDEDTLCYEKTGGEDGVNLDGVHSYRWEDIRFEAEAATQADAAAIMKAVRNRLHGWQDVSVGVQGCFAQGDSDETVLANNRHVNGQSFRIRFKPI